MQGVLGAGKQSLEMYDVIHQVLPDGGPGQVCQVWAADAIDQMHFHLSSSKHLNINLIKTNRNNLNLSVLEFRTLRPEEGCVFCQGVLTDKWVSSRAHHDTVQLYWLCPDCLRAPGSPVHHRHRLRPHQDHHPHPLSLLLAPQCLLLSSILWKIVGSFTVT